MSFKLADLSVLNSNSVPTVVCGDKSITFNTEFCTEIGICERILMYCDTNEKKVAFKKAKASSGNWKFGADFYHSIKDGAKVRVVKWTGREKVKHIRTLFGVAESDHSAKFIGYYDEKSEMIIFEISNLGKAKMAMEVKK